MMPVWPLKTGHQIAWNASLLGRIRTYIDRVMRDMERGPIFAYRILDAFESHNLLNFANYTNRMPNQYIELDSVHEGVAAIVGPARELFTKARAMGVIDDENWICAPSEDDMEALCQLTEECNTAVSTPSDTAHILFLLDKMRGASVLQLQRIEPMQRVEANLPEIRERVVYDYFVSSPVFQFKVREIIERMENTLTMADKATTALAEK